MNVLVVEDDISVGRVLQIVLESEETVDDIQVVKSGEAALAVAEEFAPDVIILDSGLPGMDGSETAPRMREMYPDARIVAFSGSIDEKPRWADDFYPKGDLPDVELLIRLDD